MINQPHFSAEYRPKLSIGACRMIPADIDYDTVTNIHHQRLCVAISESSYFKEKLYPYPQRWRPWCSVRKVSFRTEEGIEATSGTLYLSRKNDNVLFCSRY